MYSRAIASHSGPAGSTFRNIEDAGKQTLKFNCNNYPHTTDNFILPPLFISKYPEKQDPSTSNPEQRTDPPLTGQELNKFQGICSGQGGEQTEYIIFNLLTKLLKENEEKATLILRSFELNTNGKVNLKRKTILSEYNMTSINMRGEQDYIVLIKDLGMVAIEVKRTLSSKSLQKVTEQLDRSESFLNNISLAVEQNTNPLPTVKLVIFEVDDTQNLLASHSPGYEFFNCSCNTIEDFKAKWADIKLKLQRNSKTNTLSDRGFKRLARLLTGIWCMKSLNRQVYFDVDDASLSHSLTKVDTQVDHAHLSSDVASTGSINLPVTNAIRTQEDTVFRKANEICLMYLTPEQKNIFDNVKRAVIRGAAGTGKTVLTIFKIIELIQSEDDNKKIMLVAPSPHNIRCKNILQANNFKVMGWEDRDNLHDVLIMETMDLIKMDLDFALQDPYHFFLDDFHTIFADITVHETSTLINSLYNISLQTDSYFWCGIDGLQHLEMNNDKIANQILYKMYRDMDCDVHYLTGVLRNAEEISNAVLKVRDTRKSLLNIASSLVETHSAHKITSSLPTIHILIKTVDHNDDDHLDFMIDRLEKELRPFILAPDRIPLSNIAIFYANYLLKGSFNNLHEMTLEMLSRIFKIQPMSLKDQLETQTDTIVFDDVKTTASGEWPVVILLYPSSFFNDASPYLAFSRARAHLIVIDSGIGEPFKRHFASVECNSVSWCKKDGEFVRKYDISQSIKTGRKC